MENIKMTSYKKHGGGWTVIYTNSDPYTVYERLTAALIAKKLNKCAYIQTIKREPLYNGYQKIIEFSDGVKTEYIIKQ